MPFSLNSSARSRLKMGWLASGWSSRMCGTLSRNLDLSAAVGSAANCFSLSPLTDFLMFL